MGELVATGALDEAALDVAALDLGALATWGCTFLAGRELLVPATRSSTGIGPRGRLPHPANKPAATTHKTSKL